MRSANAIRLEGMSAAEKVQGPRSYFPSIETKYRKPIGEWMVLLAAAPTTEHRELVDWLKTEHGMGHGHANALVAVHLGKEGSAGSHRRTAHPNRDATVLVGETRGTVRPSS